MLTLLIVFGALHVPGWIVALIMWDWHRWFRPTRHIALHPAGPRLQLPEPTPSGRRPAPTAIPSAGQRLLG